MNLFIQENITELLPMWYFFIIFFAGRPLSRHSS